MGWGDVPSEGPSGSKGQWPQFCSFPHALPQFAVGAAGAPAPCSEKESCLSVSGPVPLLDLFYMCRSGHGSKLCSLWSSEVFLSNTLVQLVKLLRGRKPWADFT